MKANGNQINTNERNKGLIYPELSYQLMGILFKVHRRLGNSYQEKYYQRAIEAELRKEQLSFEREFQIKLNYEDVSIGKYFLDFVIDGKIALEIKAVPALKDQYFNQVLAYLDSGKFKLGIVANFRAERLFYKRLVNPRVKLLA